HHMPPPSVEAKHRHCYSRADASRPSKFDLGALREAFISPTGRGVPLRHSNVDTDQIIPASYLKRVSRTGFGDGLFAAWREDPGFVLNQPAYAGATILI